MVGTVYQGNGNLMAQGIKQICVFFRFFNLNTSAEILVRFCRGEFIIAICYACKTMRSD